MDFLGSAVVFVISYILFMLPTYYLPHLGSNSAAVGALAVAAQANVYSVFWPHFGALMSLIVAAWIRGTCTDKQWLILFPILAAVFELVPELSFMPLVPTVMHVLAIILGVAEQQLPFQQYNKAPVSIGRSGKSAACFPGQQGAPTGCHEILDNVFALLPGMQRGSEKRRGAKKTK